MKKAFIAFLALVLCLNCFAFTVLAEEDKPVIRFTVSAKENEGDWNEMFAIKYWEDQFGVDLQFEMINAQIWQEKWPLLISSGDLPDVFLYYIGATYGEQGYLLPLEDLVNEENTPNIWKMWQDEPLLKALCTEMDGHIYAIRGLDKDPSTPSLSRMYYNLDWVNRTLGHMPTNLDEFYELLKAIKENDMDGDGDPNNEIPLGGYYKAQRTINPTTDILAAMGHVTTREELQDDGSVMYVGISEDYKEFLKYVNRLYTEGLLDEEFFTITTESEYNAKNATGIFGVACAWAPYIVYPDGDDYRNYDINEPMTSAINDVKMVPAQGVRTVGAFSITEKAQDPELVMHVMDWLFSDEACDRMANGYYEQGEFDEYPDYYYKMLTDETGSKGFILVNKDGEETVPEGFESENTFRMAEIAPNYEQVPVYRNYNPIRLTERHIWLLYHIVEKQAPYYKTAEMPAGMKYTTEESKELSLLKADFQTYFDEEVTKMISGEVDIDAEWDTYVKNMKDYGVDRYIEIVQNAYDRFAGAI